MILLCCEAFLFSSMCRVATTNAPPRDEQGNDVIYENNLERLHAQAAEECAVFNEIGLTDLVEEGRASHGALVSRLNDMFVKHLETTWVPNTLRKIAAEKKKMEFEHAKLGMPPAHEEAVLAPVREAIVEAMEGACDRSVPSLLKEYSASVLHPMKRDIQSAVKQAVVDAFSAQATVIDNPNDSQILSPQQRDQVWSWLRESSCGKLAKLELLYRASRDGWQAQAFHSRCDGQGATVTVIKCTGGFVFGGYADTSWNSHGDWTRSPQAFLFSLHGPSGVGAVKLPLVQDHGHGIYCNDAYGPTFGGGHDIHVADNASGNNSSYTNLGRTYQLPSGQSSETFFTGARNFQAAEVEVYQVVQSDA